MLRPSKRLRSALFTTLITVTPQGAADSLGDTTARAAVTYYGYVYENTERVINAFGEEELSHMQIYLTGTDASAIDMTSRITCGAVSNSRIIARSIYRGRKSIPIIGVLYLP